MGIRRQSRVWTVLAAASAFTGALTGCELSRPEGAFNPVYPEAGPGLDDEFNAGDGDGSGTGDGDAPTNEDPFGDAGAPMAQTDTFKDVVGFYLARFDEHTFSSSTSSGVTIHSDNQISRFFVMKIFEEGALKSQEQLCGQVQKHVCTCESATSSCSCSSTTTIDKTAAAKFSSTMKMERDLTLEDGVLTAPLSWTYLGYKATASDHALPTSSSDTRVWDITSAAGGEGVYTALDMSVDVPVFGRTIKCQVSLVQQLGLSWEAKVKKSGTIALNGARGEFELTGAKPTILDAKASNESDRKTCMGQGSTTGTENSLEKVVKFHKVDRGTCPSNSEFESVLPAEPLTSN